jgi:hypothetical protein
MTINKLSLNTPTPDVISVAFEIDQFISFSTTNSEIDSAVAKIADSLKQHFTFFKQQKVQAEVARLQKEQEESEKRIREQLALEAQQKKRKVFSTFKTVDPSPAFAKAVQSASTAIVEDKVSKLSLMKTVNILQQLGFIPQTYLPGVYRFEGSPYAYTVKPDSWTSPFGESGEHTIDFLNNVCAKILKLDDNGKQSLFSKIAQLA